MPVRMIAAIGINRELGKNGDLIWRIPEDLEYFKNVTMGHTIIMGKKTFNSLPKLLPGRKHIILSKECDFNKDIGDSLVFNDKDELISYINTNFEDKIAYVIGGASMYSMFIDICDRMYLTEIGAEDKDADVFFPEINEDEWEKRLEYGVSHCGIPVVHYRYLRKKK